MLIDCPCGEAHEIGEDNLEGWLRCGCGRIVRAPRAAGLPWKRVKAASPTRPVRPPSRVVVDEETPALHEADVASRRPERRAAATKWLVRLTWAYVALVAIACVALWTLSDRWWPATLLLFGPRWVLLLPLLALIPAAATLRRSVLIPLSAAAIVVLVPVMGLKLGGWSWFGRDNVPATLRVLTLNAGASEALGLELPFRLEQWRADIVALQECGPRLRDDVRRIQGWHHHIVRQLCLLSRYPIRDALATNWEDLAPAREAGIGGSGRAAQYVIDTPQRPIKFVNVHLETAREGLEGLFELDVRRVAENTMLRAVESRRTRDWVGDADGFLLIAGDFNMPVESAIYRQYWSRFRNAFSEAGLGFGMTKDNGWIQARIDHILTGDEWHVKRVVVGPVVGLDHRPVIADLSLRRSHSVPP